MKPHRNMLPTLLLFLILPCSALSQGADIPLGIVAHTDNHLYVMGSSAAGDGTMEYVIYAIDANGEQQDIQRYRGLGSVIPSGFFVSGDEIVMTGTEIEGNDGNILTVAYKRSDIVAIDDDADPPAMFDLSQNYPNPVAGGDQAVIHFSIPERAQVRLLVTSLTGEVVATLLEDALDAGSYSTKFIPGSLPSGTYFYVLTSSRHLSVRKLVVTR